jgi:IS1 family transposase
VINKSETCLVESKNSSLRDNLARLNRRTKKHSKSEEMLRLSVSLLLKKNKIKDYL